MFEGGTLKFPVSVCRRKTGEEMVTQANQRVLEKRARNQLFCQGHLQICRVERPGTPALLGLEQSQGRTETGAVENLERRPEIYRFPPCPERTGTPRARLHCVKRKLVGTFGRGGLRGQENLGQEIAQQKTRHDSCRAFRSVPRCCLEKYHHGQ